METPDDALVADDMALGIITCRIAENGAKEAERLEREEQKTLTHKLDDSKD
uniref:Uncharacterized protein n=1 Tax=Peronospora matthiolae TaxID=2874970 RepID=A0AAV1TKG6_9STRA